MEGIDLSCWRFAFNGAEPVSPDTIAAFEQRFAQCGLRKNALAPVYGLAECTVGVAFTAPGDALAHRRARPRQLSQNRARRCRRGPTIRRRSRWSAAAT